MPRQHSTKSARAAILPGLDFDEEESGAEEWRAIAGWPGYDVSDWGRVRSYWRTTGIGIGAERYEMVLRPRLRRLTPGSSGHLLVPLSRRSPRGKKCFQVHVLVLEAFREPRPPKMQACHNDGNAQNNHISNLRWDTKSSNQIDILYHGGKKNARLLPAVIPSIWARLVAGDKPGAIGADYGVSGGVISALKEGKSWTHITRGLPGWPIYPPVGEVKDVSVRPPIEILLSRVELWRGLPGFPTHRISSYGRVMSCRISDPARDRKSGAIWVERKPGPCPSGHLGFTVRGGPGRSRYFSVHRAVLESFAGPCPPGLVGCHIDGDLLNNRVDNLRWDTQRSNVLDKFRHARERRAVPTT